MNDILKTTEKDMRSTTSLFETELKTLRAGRVNPSVLDKIFVDYYGTPTRVVQLASVSVSESRILVVQPYDVSCLKLVERALQGADLGINPQTDGRVIRLIFPKITEDQRKDLVKDISKTAESYKVKIRNIRRDALDKLKKLKKDSQITEDELNADEKKIQKLTDDFCNSIESMLDAKQKEIMTI